MRLPLCLLLEVIWCSQHRRQGSMKGGREVKELFLFLGELLITKSQEAVT